MSGRLQSRSYLSCWKVCCWKISGGSESGGGECGGSLSCFCLSCWKVCCWKISGRSECGGSECGVETTSSAVTRTVCVVIFNFQPFSSPYGRLVKVGKHLAEKLGAVECLNTSYASECTA